MLLTNCKIIKFASEKFIGVKVFYSAAEINNKKTFVATIGTFDGVHLGHKMILSALKSASQNFQHESLLITFHPHPRLVLQSQDASLSFLNTLEEKLHLLEKAGIDNVLIQEFTPEFSQLSAQDFLKEYLQKRLNIKHLIVGYDHSFGKKEPDEHTSIENLLLESGIYCTIIPKKEIDAISVSSTKIRKAIEQGDFETANAFLGYEFSLTGNVVEGEKIGRLIGFPTANIQLSDYTKILPAYGVYAVKILVNNRNYNGMLNYGFKPTLGNRECVMEVNIFDFSEKIYGDVIKVFFIRKIREEMKFKNVETLSLQLEKDKAQCNKILN